MRTVVGVTRRDRAIPEKASVGKHETLEGSVVPIAQHDKLLVKVKGLCLRRHCIMAKDREEKKSGLGCAKP